MTDEQMRIAIAEACGFANISFMCWRGHLDGYERCIPDYLNDLNAMHEAEKTFADDDVIAEKYWLALYDATEHTRWPYDATARQRAEAFLKTKGIIP